MQTLLQAVIDRDIPTNELVAAVTLYTYTEEPTIAQMTNRWNVPDTDIYQLFYVLSRANNPEQAILLFKSILYLVEAGIYTNVSQLMSKLSEI